MFAYYIADFAEVFTKGVLMNSKLSISEMKNAIRDYSEVTVLPESCDVILIVSIDLRRRYKKSTRRRRRIQGTCERRKNIRVSLGTNRRATQGRAEYDIDQTSG